MSADAQPDRDAPPSRSPSAAISDVVRIQREDLGREPSKARTSIRDDAVLVLEPLSAATPAGASAELLL